MAYVHHELLDIWHMFAPCCAGLHGTHGAQVISVQYDFQGSTARIVATKVTGDRDVPAGERRFACTACIKTRIYPTSWPQK